MPAGRPTDYTQDLADKICERLASGESMRSVSRDDDMPVCSAIFRWIRTYPEFKEQYTRAKEESADALIEDSLEIADNEASRPLLIDDVPMMIDGKVVMIADAASVAHAKLRIETRKWMASKLKPKKYGDKVTQEISGIDGEAIKTRNVVEWVIQPVKTRDDLDQNA